MSTGPKKPTPEEIEEAKLCSVKGCNNPGTWLPLFTVACKGPKGRGKNAKRMTSTLPTPMCDNHIRLPKARDYFKFIDWRRLHVRFNAEGLPAPKRSTSQLEWVKAEG